MSSPNEPEEIASTSIERSFLPSFITEPLPNWRSIWESAAAKALVLSMEDPSTIRRAVVDIGSCSLWRGFGCGTNDWRGGSSIKAMYPICSRFAICSFGRFGAGPFPTSVAQFENQSGLLWLCSKSYRRNSTADFRIIGPENGGPRH